MKKKLAICLYGLAGQSRTWKDGEYQDIDNMELLSKVRAKWQKNLKWEGEIDFFIHTWDKRYQAELERLYEPKMIVAESQRHFNVWPRIFKEFAQMKGVKKRLKFLYNIYNSWPREKQLYWAKRTFAAMSRWYSTCQSIEICKKYSEMNAIHYNLVISARLDLVLINELNINSCKPGKLYLGHFNSTPNAAQNIKADYTNLTLKKDKLSDLIFISALKNIDLLTDINHNFMSYSISPHAAAFEAFNKTLSRDDFEYIFYPWIDVSTVKTYFYGWELGQK